MRVFTSLNLVGPCWNLAKMCRMNMKWWHPIGPRTLPTAEWFSHTVFPCSFRMKCRPSLVRKKLARCAKTPQSILLVSHRKNVSNNHLLVAVRIPSRDGTELNWPPDRQSAEAVARGRASHVPTRDPSEGHGSTEVESPAAWRNDPVLDTALAGAENSPVGLKQRKKTGDFWWISRIYEYYIDNI